MEITKINDYNVWLPDSYTFSNGDIRFEILKYAILAANTHNIQPWKIHLINKDGIDLYIDSKRLLLHTDPDIRHIYISQGTFIETFIIAASHFGYNCVTTLLPYGIPSMKELDETPIATIKIQRAEFLHEDELFGMITKRCTNHNAFSRKDIPQKDKMELFKSNRFEEDGFQMKIFDTPEMLNKISKLMIEGMKIQANTPGPHSETIKMIRFRKKDLRIKKDGFSFNDLGVKGIKLKLAEIFATPKMTKTVFFKRNIVRAIEKMAMSAKAYVFIYAPEDSRSNQIISGQIFCNVHLRATLLGLSFQPMDHILQKYTELSTIESKMRDLVELKGKTPMAVFRIGYSNTSYHTPRRTIIDLLK